MKKIVSLAFLLSISLNLKAPIFGPTGEPLYLDKESGIYYLEEPPRLQSSFYLCNSNKTKIILVADCYSDGIIKIYPGDGDRNSLICNLVGHNSPILFVEISRDGKEIYSWSQDRTKITWDTSTRNPTKIEIEDFLKRK